MVRFCQGVSSAPAQAEARFNPTLVRFCPEYEAWLRKVRFCFNPTLVRFCPETWRRRCNRAIGFQSHLGSILPWAQLSSTQSCVCFNPTLVRFCPSLPSESTSGETVSIPPWFDFAAGDYQHVLAVSAVSIPPWFDFAPATVIVPTPDVLVSIPPWFDFADVVDGVLEAHLLRFNPTLVRFCQSCGPAPAAA